MFNKLILEIKNMDNSIKHVMFLGLKLSLVICLFSIFILHLYCTYPVSYIAYDSSLILFRTGSFFAAYFFISAFITNRIK